MGTRASLGTRSASRLVARIRTAGHCATSADAIRAASSRTCSHASRTMSAPASPRREVTRASGSEPRMSTASARSRTASSASPARARSTSQMPSRNSCSSERAASSARRLLPTPGGPVSVTRRCSPRRPATWASSSSRPTNDVESAGRLPRRLRSTGTAAIAGSCARIASWRRRSSSPGSSPSSSPSTRRASWNASSASAWRPLR